MNADSLKFASKLALALLGKFYLSTICRGVAAFWPVPTNKMSKKNLKGGQAAQFAPPLSEVARLAPAKYEKENRR